MKKINLLIVLSISNTMMSFAQNAYTSFEEPAVFTIEYTDTGDPSAAHDLLNNTNEPNVDYTFTGGELGFNARYEPYDTPGDGLSDGDFVGVTEDAPSIPFPDGLQGYLISDADGNFIVEFDPVLISSPLIQIDYFISETGYEGDGTVNTSGSDRLRIYVKNLDDNMEYDLLDTTGNDINDLNIEGVWNTVNVAIENSPDITVKLIIEARNNAGTEAFFFDNISFTGTLGLSDVKDNLFSIYPNPANSNFVNIVSQIEGPKEVTVCTILGEQVIKTTHNTNLLDITQLNSGIYLVKIIQGTTSVTKKLVVK